MVQLNIDWTKRETEKKKKKIVGLTTSNLYDDLYKLCPDMLKPGQDI